MTAEEEPAGRDRNFWGAILRVDCKSLPRRDAERYIREYDDIVTVVIQKVRRGLSWAAVTRADARSVGRFAILEAVLTYRDDRTASLKTWVRSVVHWRIALMLEKCTRPEGEVLNHTVAMTVFERQNDIDFEEQQLQRDLLRVLANNFALLPHRSRVILLNRLSGVSSDETASELGITPQREQQIVAASRALLQDARLAFEAEASEGSGGTSSVAPWTDPPSSPPPSPEPSQAPSPGSS